MNSVCRICFDDNVVQDWSNTLVEYHDISYKDCYYKYTGLKPLGLYNYDADPFSSMLCQNCLNGLENVHALIMKAVDSHNFLLEDDCMNCDIEELIIIEDGVNYSTDFETILLQNPDAKSVIHKEYADDCFHDTSIKAKETQFQKIVDIGNEMEDTNQSLQISTEDNVSKSMNLLCGKSEIGNSRKTGITENATFYEDNKLTTVKTSCNTRHKKSEIYLSDNKNESISASKRRKVKTKQEVTPCMCSFCSKILHSIYSLRAHEKTHSTNRERKAPCPICGVKFLSESYVRAHMQIHNDNREKKHKCEFCDKAFFDKGSLNVHRRIHLGKMIPCTICSKEFCRQVDLEKHMSSHSATLITAGEKKKSRYWVRCEHCNKDIISTKFKSHTAVHLNEPLMKCSICNKEFFRRDSCTDHLKSTHKKTAEEYNHFIILYKKNRLSHLYLKQTANLQQD